MGQAPSGAADTQERHSGIDNPPTSLVIERLERPNDYGQSVEFGTSREAFRSIGTPAGVVIHKVMLPSFVVARYRFFTP